MTQYFTRDLRLKTLVLTPGDTPTSPVDGQAWVTEYGMFVQINGYTVGPLLGAPAEVPPFWADAQEGMWDSGNVWGEGKLCFGGSVWAANKEIWK